MIVIIEKKIVNKDHFTSILIAFNNGKMFLLAVTPLTHFAAINK